MFAYGAGSAESLFTWEGVNGLYIWRGSRNPELTVFANHLFATGCPEGIDCQLAADGAAQLDWDLILWQGAECEWLALTSRGGFTRGAGLSYLMSSAKAGVTVT